MTIPEIKSVCSIQALANRWKINTNMEGAIWPQRSLSLCFCLSNKTQWVKCSHSSMDLQLAVISCTLIIELTMQGRVYVGGAYNIKGVTFIRVCVCAFIGHVSVFEALCNKHIRICVKIHVPSIQHTGTMDACIYSLAGHVFSAWCTFLCFLDSWSVWNVVITWD